MRPKTSELPTGLVLCLLIFTIDCYLLNKGKILAGCDWLHCEKGAWERLRTTMASLSTRNQLTKTQFQAE